MLDGLGDPGGRELGAHPLDLGQPGAQAFAVGAREAVGLVEQEELVLVEERVDHRGQPPEPEIGYAVLQEPFDVRRGRELQVGASREHGLPPREVGVGLEQLAQTRARVAQEHPTERVVGGGHLGHPAGPELVEEDREPDLRRVVGRLEPEDPVRRRDAHHRGPDPDVRLLDRAGHLGVIVDPRVRPLEERGIGPAPRHGSGRARPTAPGTRRTRTPGPRSRRGSRVRT